MDTKKLQAIKTTQKENNYLKSNDVKVNLFIKKSNIVISRK